MICVMLRLVKNRLLLSLVACDWYKRPLLSDTASRSACDSVCLSTARILYSSREPRGLPVRYYYCCYNANSMGSYPHFFIFNQSPRHIAAHSDRPFTGYCNKYIIRILMQPGLYHLYHILILVYEGLYKRCIDYDYRPTIQCSVTVGFRWTRSESYRAFKPCVISCYVQRLTVASQASNRVLCAPAAGVLIGFNKVGGASFPTDAAKFWTESRETVANFRQKRWRVLKISILPINFLKKRGKRF